MKHLLLILAACAGIAMCATAQEKQEKFYKLYGPGIFVNVDRSAMFPRGTMAEGFQYNVGRNFVYSKELWKQLRCRRFRIDCTVTRSGLVTDVSVWIPNDKPGEAAVAAPQEVTDQISLLCDDLPRLVPAMVQRNDVSSRYSTTVSVADTYGTMPSGRRHTGLPYSFAPWIRKMRAVAADKTYKGGMPRLAAGKKIERLAEIADVVPEYARTSSAYARLLAAVGRRADAYRHTAVAAARYADINWWANKGDSAVFNFSHSWGYEGKTEVWLHVLQTAIAYDADMPADTIAHASDEARSLVDRKISNHDIVNISVSNIGGGDYTRYRRLMDEKFSIAMGSRGSIASDEKAALDHEQVSGRSMAMIDRYISEGKITSARIMQINHELEEIENRVSEQMTVDEIPGIAVNTAHMYAVNALLEYLRAGTAAQDRYLRSAIEGAGKPYAKELEAVRAAIACAALTDADRKAVARCIAAYAPIKGVDDAKRFYELRKRVWAAYPMEWLGRCDI